MKTLIIILATIFASLTASATEQPKGIEANVVNDTKVKVKLNVEIKVGETYEIQKSYDNNNFTTLATVMGTEDAANMPSFSFSDNNAKANVIYYRMVKIEHNKQTTVADTIVRK